MLKTILRAIGKAFVELLALLLFIAAIVLVADALAKLDVSEPRCDPPRVER